MLRRILLQKLTDVSEVLPAAIVITLMKKTVSTSETSVNFHEGTRLKIPEDSHLHIRRCEKLKSRNNESRPVLNTTQFQS
jgi:hypothetical protein